MNKQIENRTVSWRVAALMAVGAGVVGSAMALALAALIGLPFLTVAQDTSTTDSTGVSAEAVNATADDANNSSVLNRTDVGAAANPVQAALHDAANERTQISRSMIDLNRRGEMFDRRLAEIGGRLERAEKALSDVSTGSSGGDPSLVATAVASEAGENEFLPEGVDDSIAAFDGRAERDERSALIAAGVDPQRVNEIGQRRDQFQLARLDLIDQASREGWRESDRFEEQMSNLRDQQPDLRSELGDDAYDRYLFEQGGTNRVGVAAVIEGSAASLAGILPGDVIVSYGNDRVFQGRELQSATRAGSRGENVQVSVRRGDEIMAVELPRGPLGVTLDAFRLTPQ